MKRTCLFLLGASLLATPAAARDKTLYLGIEGGILWAKDMDFDLVDDGENVADDFATIDHKMGYDVAAIFGYDGGMVRAELELAYKRASHDEYTIRSEGTETFDGDGSTRYVSIMTNLLLDVGDENGASFYAGPGAGFAWGKIKLHDDVFGDTSIRDGGVAWQLIAGARYAVSPNVDVGLKYRYFHPSRFKEEVLQDGIQARGRFTSHSLLATLTYNFYRQPPPPPPPPVLPPPPPPPPPATQTCPDGSVILATDVCPPPPPPPPPPVIEPEKG
jgi:opacity protein-like surface antigen